MSWGGPLTRLATEAPPLAIAFWRTAIATAVVLPLAAVRRRQELISIERRDWLLMMLSGLFLSVHFGTWIASIDLTTIAASAFLVTSHPLWVALFSVVVGDRLSRRGWLGICLAVGGGAMVGVAGTGTSGNAATGNLLALAGAIAAAAYLLVGRLVRPRVSILTYAAVAYGACTLFLLATATLGGVALTGFTPGTWLAIVLLGVGPQLLGHTTFNFALGDLEAWKVAAATMGEPIGSALIAALLFGEIPRRLVFAGGLLLVLGIGLALSSGKPVRVTPSV